MAKVLVAYHSRGGSTRKMAEKVADGVKSAGVDCDLLEINEVSPEILTD